MLEETGVAHAGRRLRCERGSRYVRFCYAGRRPNGEAARRLQGWRGSGGARELVAFWFDRIRLFVDRHDRSISS